MIEVSPSLVSKWESRRVKDPLPDLSTSIDESIQEETSRNLYNVSSNYINLKKPLLIHLNVDIADLKISSLAQIESTVQSMATLNLSQQSQVKKLQSESSQRSSKKSAEFKEHEVLRN
jgi:hypothetical protein